MKIVIKTGIDFADAELHALSLKEIDKLIVYIQAWDEGTIEVVFSDVLCFSYFQGDVLQGLYENDVSSYLQEAVDRHYVEKPKSHPYKLFQIEDIHDFPTLQVVATKYHIEKFHFSVKRY